MPLFLVDGLTPDSSEEWVVPSELLDCVNNDADVAAAAAAMAAAIMAAMSGGAFGLTTQIVRPHQLTETYHKAPAYSYPLTGGCGLRRALMTFPEPITEITEITVDGVALAEGDWRLYDQRLLVRADGETWPCCQDLTLADTEVGTWSIAYTSGREVPVGGQQAAGLLGCAIGQAMLNDDTCALPSRVDAITRQDVTTVLLDNQDFLDKRRTGIETVDLWLASVNPYGVTSASAVYHPEMVGLPKEA